jgi:CDP-diacylglycerol--glycerol-3-phosphate 3-phosphatidyltransferase
VSGSRWNMANLLTLLRLPLAATGAYFLWQKEYVGVAIGFMAAAALTDVLDGIVARALGQVTDFGKKFDPVVDKVAIAGVGIILVVKYGVPWWIFAVAVGRDVIIVASAWLIIRRRDVVIPANFWGKAAASVMVLYGISAVLASGSWVTDVLLWTVLASVIVSSASYGYEFYKALTAERRGQV